MAAFAGAVKTDCLGFQFGSDAALGSAINYRGRLGRAGDPKLNELPRFCFSRTKSCVTHAVLLGLISTGSYRQTQQVLRFVLMMFCEPRP